MTKWQWVMGWYKNEGLGVGNSVETGEEVVWTRTTHPSHEQGSHVSTHCDADNTLFTPGQLPRVRGDFIIQNAAGGGWLGSIWWKCLKRNKMYREATHKSKFPATHWKNIVHVAFARQSKDRLITGLFETLVTDWLQPWSNSHHHHCPWAHGWAAPGLFWK